MNTSLLLLLFLALQSSEVSIAANENCPTSLSQSPSADALRGELLSVREDYIKTFCKFDPMTCSDSSPSSYSQQIGPEAPFLQNQYVGGHVISLGSGPDVFQPLYLFPRSSHFHLVDTFLGWGGSTQVVIDELLRRLQFLHGFKHIEVVKWGDHAWNVEIKWKSKMYGVHTKYFYIHRADFRKLDEINAVLFSIPQGGVLEGVLLTGAPQPPNRILKRILDRLSPGGSYIEGSTWRKNLESFPFLFSQFGRLKWSLTGSHNFREIPYPSEDPVYNSPGVYNQPREWIASYIFTKQ